MKQPFVAFKTLPGTDIRRRLLSGTLRHTAGTTTKRYVPCDTFFR